MPKGATTEQRMRRQAMRETLDACQGAARRGDEALISALSQRATAADVIAQIEQVDRLLDANMTALFIRVRCIPQTCWGFETAYRRHPDLRAEQEDLIRQRGRLQLERDRLLNIEYAREQRREAAKRAARTRKLRTTPKCPACKGSGLQLAA